MVTATAPTVEERLDRMAAQLEVLTDEMMRQREARERWAELAEDLTPVSAAAMASLTRTLEDLGDEFTLEQLADFAKTLAVSLPTLEAMLGQLTSLAELVETVGPLAGPAMESTVERLATLEQRGYFDIARSGMGVVDRVVTSFSEEDVEALGDNIVLILQTVRDMTQPEVMQMLQRTFTTVQHDEQVEFAEPPGILDLLRQMRDPDTRRGLAKVLHMLRSVGDEPAGGPQTRR
jgi:uncharacterized protein YjgD (DUF1641 family)